MQEPGISLDSLSFTKPRHAGVFSLQAAATQHLLKSFFSRLPMLRAWLNAGGQDQGERATERQCEDC